MVPESEPKALAITPKGGLAPVQEIEALVKRAEYLGEKLDQLRKIAVARTFPSDWIQMGGSCYLEGDGGLRMAPILGLNITNKRVVEQVLEDGVVRVTASCDAASNLFGTAFQGIERTRRTDDQFLRRGGKVADIEDVRSAAYKGMIAKAAQFCAGLTGLTAEELKARFGMEVGGKVEYQTGKADARKADKATVAASGSLPEIHRLLRKLSEGDDLQAAEILRNLTKDDAKGWPGKTRPEDLSEKGVAFVLRELKRREVEFDAVEADIAARKEQA